MQTDEHIKSGLTDYIERTLKRGKYNFYTCPYCGSGTGANGSPAFKPMPDKLRFKCFSCGQAGDLIDLIEQCENITTAEAWNRARELYGSGQSLPANNHATTTKTAQTGAELGTNDFIQYAKALQERPNPAADYLRGRGFNIDFLKSYLVGYDGKNIIIPYLGGEGYFLRGIGTDYKGKRGKQELYNAHALRDQKPVFIVEGQLDALAVIQSGGQAVALGSTNNANILIDYINNNFISCELLLSLDNDEAGQKATEEIETALKGLKTPHKRANISGAYKDPAERLKRDFDGLQHAIKAYYITEGETMNEETKTAEAEAVEAYKKKSAAHKLAAFKQEAANGKNNATSTGFNNIDTETGGGLPNGLTVIGAESSLGKSALVMQIAEQIAAAGKDIIIFSLEMAEREIIARSLSRLSYLNGTPKTAQELQRGETIPAAAENAYLKYANNIYIFQAVAAVTAQKIAETVRQHKKHTGAAPVVVIDYLQLIAPANQYETDKGRLDNAVMILKMLAHELATPIITISSLNRASYNEPVKMSALKESGGVEYTADLIAGLQLAATESGSLSTLEANAERKKPARDMSLTILKNRNGSTGGTVYFKYYAAYNYFEETKKSSSTPKNYI